MKWIGFFCGCVWVSLMIIAIIFKDSSFRIPYIIACFALAVVNWTNAFSKD